MLLKPPICDCLLCSESQTMKNAQHWSFQNWIANPLATMHIFHWWQKQLQFNYFEVQSQKTKMSMPAGEHVNRGAMKQGRYQGVRSRMGVMSRIKIGILKCRENYVDLQCTKTTDPTSLTSLTWECWPLKRQTHVDFCTTWITKRKTWFGLA